MSINKAVVCVPNWWLISAKVMKSSAGGLIPYSADTTEQSNLVKCHYLQIYWPHLENLLNCAGVKQPWNALTGARESLLSHLAHAPICFAKFIQKFNWMGSVTGIS
jgi:hypothetical protein